MPTVARLRGRRAFADLAREGRSVRSGPLRVRYFVAPGDVNVGYAIGKRCGGAVERNRIRRRLRAAVADSTTPLRSGSYLISADASVLRTPFASLVEAVDAVAVKAQPSTRPARMLRAVIGIYQGFSAARPPRCRYYPSCSSYAAEAIEVHGAGRGLWLAVKRLSRCAPWGSHGVDLVPEFVPQFAPE